MKAALDARLYFLVASSTFKVDDFAKSHQRAPGGAPESMTGIASH